MVEAAICFFVVVVMLLNGKDMILGCAIKRFFFFFWNAWLDISDFDTGEGSLVNLLSINPANDREKAVHRKLLIMMKYNLDETTQMNDIWIKIVNIMN